MAFPAPALRQGLENSRAFKGMGELMITPTGAVALDACSGGAGLLMLPGMTSVTPPFADAGAALRHKPNAGSESSEAFLDGAGEQANRWTGRVGRGYGLSNPFVDWTIQMIVAQGDCVSVRQARAICVGVYDGSLLR